MAFLSDDAQIAACGGDPDPSDGMVRFRSRAAIEGWLRARAADHDRLEIGRIFDENPAQPVGVVGVEFARRTSDTLAARGFPDGIVSTAAAKIVFASQDRIAWFVMGC